MELLPQRLVRKALNTDLAFASLPAIQQLRDHLDQLEAAAIASARERGASWADIAEALGVTRQAIQQRVQRGPTRKKPGPAPRARS